MKPPSTARLHEALKPVQATLKGERAKEDLYNVHNLKSLRPGCTPLAKFERATIENAMHAQGQPVLAFNCLPSSAEWIALDLNLPVGSSLQSGVAVPPVDNRSLVFYRVCLPRAWWEPFSAEKQRGRRASKGKGKIINLPWLNQSFVAGIGSVGSVTYQSYRGKKYSF